MASQIEIDAIQAEIDSINESITAYQAVLDNPAKSEVSKQLATRNLATWNAKLAAKQAQLAQLQGQPTPAPNQAPAVDTAGIAAAAEAQNANTVKDPAIVAQEAETAAAIARIDANRTAPNPQQTPSEGVAAIVAAQNETAKEQSTVSNSTDAGPVDHGPAYDDEGNLAPGYALNENGDPVWQSAGYNDATGETVKAISDDPGVAVDHGPPYDDDGNLMPGWSLDEENNPVWMGSGSDGKMFVEPATAKSAEESRNAAAAAKTSNATAKTANADSVKFEKKPDWRVRLGLSPGANYLYKVAKAGDILFPLKGTDGIIFPYLPQVNVNYKANYDPTDITHSNYKLFMYKNSAVEDVQITADFTAQDTSEANYLLAVIHFLRSSTKMFYGQDGKSGPRAGTPPPLCYLSGFGAFQFDNHPLVITNFNYSLPNDVDYIRAGVTSTWGGQTMTQYGTKEFVPNSVFGQMAQGLRDFRLAIGNLKKGAAPAEPQFKSLSNTEATYVPTKMQIQITASPIVTRNDISNNFSLTEYATGKLLRGSQRSGGGIW